MTHQFTTIIYGSMSETHTLNVRFSVRPEHATSGKDGDIVFESVSYVRDAAEKFWHPTGSDDYWDQLNEAEWNALTEQAWEHHAGMSI